MTGIAGVFCTLAYAGPAARPLDVSTEEHIRRVTANLPPAVILDGEPVKVTSLSQRMAALHVPGLSVAVVHHGKLAWARGFGVARAGGRAVTEATLFQAASISKPITALAVLKLVDEGRIDLDTDINQYLRSWKLPDNEFTVKRKVTVRELLSHTGGVTEGGFGGYRPGEPLPTLLQMLDGKPPANNPPMRVVRLPDTAWGYSGSGYVILRQILEDVTGQPFAQLLQQSLLTPLGMTHSTFQQPLSAAALAAAAQPHDDAGHIVSTGPRIYPELAPDGLWTTAADLAHYEIAVQASLAGKPSSVISAATARMMLTPRLFPYGLGTVIGDDPQHPWFAHNGGNYGYPSLFVAYNEGEGAVIMANGADGFELEIDLLRSIAQEYGWPNFRPFTHHVVAVDGAELARYVGAYELSRDHHAAVTLEDGRLFFQTSDRARQSMYPLSATDFVLKEPTLDYFYNRADETRVSFKIDARGSVAELTVAGNPWHAGTARRLADQEAQPILAAMASITHRFQQQTPAAGGEQLLRRLIADIAAGNLEEELLTPRLSGELKSLRTVNRQMFTDLGPVVSISYVRTDGVGVDTYRVVFKNGVGEMVVGLQGGKLGYVEYHPS